MIGIPASTRSSLFLSWRAAQRRLHEMNATAHFHNIPVTVGRVPSPVTTWGEGTPTSISETLTPGCWPRFYLFEGEVVDIHSLVGDRESCSAFESGRSTKFSELAAVQFPSGFSRVSRAIAFVP